MDDKNGAKADLVSSGAPSKAWGSANSPVSSGSAALSGALGAKKVGTKFKLNPRAAAFTPSRPPQMTPVPPKASPNKSDNSSPRTHGQRPYSNSSSSGSTGRRHYQVSPADFFGGVDKIPTAQSQKEKAKLFKNSFNMFAAAVKEHEGKSTALILEKAYKTPPTWDSTVDERYDKIVVKQSSGKVLPVSPVPHAPFMTSPVMAVPTGVPPMMAAGYMGSAGNGGKFPVSPHMQQPMGGQFQQQFHPSMMYSQFQGGVPPGQLQVMYAPPGMDPLLFSPGGFMMPGYMGSPVPMNGGASFQGVAHSHIKLARARATITVEDASIRTRGQEAMTA
ncbi:hypothetical protein METBIDRAFT_32837, partial [Metschnikowia bicuspidata var. bicuspidata NRRL YB-4993]